MNEQNQTVSVPVEAIISKIYVIRGKKVMLDSELAELYKVETRNLNKAVKRNLGRFPADFMFQLSKEESTNLMFQFGTSSWGGKRKLPYVFTEQGVAMLSSVLKSDRAVQVNIQIIRTFTKLREILMENKTLAERLEKLELRYDKDTMKIFRVINYLYKKQEEPKKEEAPKEKLGYRTND